MAPDDITAHSNLARILATARDPELRDLAEAERLARRAIELGSGRGARSHAVLAEVHFAQQRVADAIASAQTAVTLAQELSDAELLSEIRTRLDFYRLVQSSESTP